MAAERGATVLDDPSVKLGLALSGGGFRASLFHIGVLARMAELDVLRRVAVLSTVSGGSIIGAHYYLKVKELLEGKRADKLRPGRAAYIQIVKEIEVDFLAGVQANIRMRTFLNPLKNVRMLQEDYSRSDHIAELYRDYFYTPVWGRVKEPDQSDAIHLGDIKIHPTDDVTPPALRGQVFDVGKYNQSAPFKIPVLTINATCLNTGHPWEFTSSWVGEVPARDAIVRRIDSNRVLERLRFDGTVVEEPGAPRPPLAPDRQESRRKKLQELTLGDAVAASACVPGIFHPFAIHDLYWNSAGDEIVVQLVDGGVYDNQGLEALFAADCTHIVCSDASGQMEDELAPSTQFYSVLKRSNDILMDRVRDDGLKDLFVRERGEKLLAPLPAAHPLRAELADHLDVREYAFFHLKDEFAGTAEYPSVPGPVDRHGLIYRLSNIRTDLDSFTDLEAYTLMYDGYCLSGEHIAKQKDLGATVTLTGRDTRWRFLAIRDVLRDPQAQRRLLKHLKVGANAAFKVFALGDWRAYLAATPFAAAFVALLGYGIWVMWTSHPHVDIDVARVLSSLLGSAVVAVLSLNKTVKKWMKRYRQLRRLRNGFAVFAFYTLPVAVALGSIAVWVHLKIFDKLFLRRGRIPP